MRTTEYFHFGEYKQTIVLEDKKIIDATCNCVYGVNNQKAWKNAKTLCKHIQSALTHLDLKTKNDNLQKINSN